MENPEAKFCSTCKRYEFDEKKGAHCRPYGGKKQKAYAAVSGKECWEIRMIDFPGVGSVPESDADMIHEPREDRPREIIDPGQAAEEETETKCAECANFLPEVGWDNPLSCALNPIRQADHNREEKCEGWLPIEQEPVEPTIAKDGDFGTRPEKPTAEESQAVIDDPEATPEEKLEKLNTTIEKKENE